MPYRRGSSASEISSAWLERIAKRSENQYEPNTMATEMPANSR